MKAVVKSIFLIAGVVAIVLCGAALLLRFGLEADNSLLITLGLLAIAAHTLEVIYP